MFDYDWFHGLALKNQHNEAKMRCTEGHFSGVARADFNSNEEVKKFYDNLEVRTLIYLRDGFSYEVKGFADVETKSHLVFECEPVDEQYKVGAFVVTVPFDEIVRVEAFAVHPNEKPDELPQITGFRGHPEQTDHKFIEPRPGKSPR